MCFAFLENVNYMVCESGKSGDLATAADSVKEAAANMFADVD